MARPPLKSGSRRRKNRSKGALRHQLRTFTEARGVKITRADGSVEYQRPYTPQELRQIVKERLVTAKLREKVMARDRGTCRYCGGPGEVVDHVIPIAKGGHNGMHNLVAACVACNSAKGTSTEWKPQPRKS